MFLTCVRQTDYCLLFENAYECICKLCFVYTINVYATQQRNCQAPLSLARPTSRLPSPTSRVFEFPRPPFRPPRRARYRGYSIFATRRVSLQRYHSRSIVCYSNTHEYEQMVKQGSVRFVSRRWGGFCQNKYWLWSGRGKREGYQVDARQLGLQ
jgi:hypothetical protein